MQDGQTATNPQTGEKVVLRGGQWVPVGQTAPARKGPTFVPGMPKQPDALEMRRLELSEQSNARSNAANERAAAAAERQAKAAERQLGNDAFNQASKLRDDYNADKTVQGFTRTLPAYMSALRSVDGSPAGDLALTYAFATVMDPNSAVREGEQQMVSGSDTLFGRTVAQLKNQMDRSGNFSPELRKDLLKRLRERGGEMRAIYDGIRRDYESRAKRAGIEPLDVLPRDPALEYGDRELRFWAEQGDPQAVQELRRREVEDADRYGNPTGGGEFKFSDQVAERVEGYQLEPAQEKQIKQAIRDGDEGQTLALFRKFSGYEPTDDTVSTVREAIKAARKNPNVEIQISSANSDEAYKAKLRALNEQGDDLQAGGQPSDLSLLAAQGGVAGFSDEIAGATGSVAALLLGKDAGKAYSTSRDAELLRLEDARKRAGVLGTVAEIGGGFATPVGALGRPGQATTLISRVRQGARAGALGGALAGVGYGDGSNRVVSGTAGAAGGALAGAALPVVGKVISNRVGGMARLIGRDPELPRRLVSEAITADSNTPRAVGMMLDDAGSRGSPMAIADTGDNARQLLASVGRQPGPSRTITREAVVERQLAQQERIAGAVVRDLGPTANIREASERLIEEARTASAPHYAAFEAAPGASSVRLDDLAKRPSVKKGLAGAYRLAAEEGVDPTTLGFALNEAGEVTLERVPSFKTLDYVKRGLDDVVESYRDGVTGKLRLDTEGRAVNNTLRMLISRIDKVNPAYKAARDAYAGPAKLDEALQKGSKALSRAPDDLSAEIAKMSEPEREMYRLGLRKSITDFLESRTDGGDKVQALMGTPKKRAALARAFGGRAEYDRFIATLGDEAAMGQTYRAVTGNSSTAERLAFDQTTSDTGLAETAMDAALRGGKEGLGAAAIALVQRMRDVGRFGAGEAGQRTRESVAALLTETDPAALRELVRAAQRAQALQRVRDRSSAGPRRVINSGVGNQIGRGVGVMLPRSEKTEK